MRRMYFISALMLMLSVTMFTGCDDVVVPTVVTGEVINITETSCDVGGMVLDHGGSLVLNRGVCYGTETNPDISGDFVSNDNGMDTIYCHISGLTPGTTYYVRAYAINIGGTGYGESVKFTTSGNSGGEEPTNAPEGAVNGLFSVSETEKVYFSKGNLQYQASTNTWRFAEPQWDFVGAGNSNISSTYSGWIDLFGWGTSGWNSGNTYYHPWDVVFFDGYYGPVGEHDLTGEYANCDWGHNPISNGGNLPDQWRTLTKMEWRYVLNIRATISGMRYTKAQVNNVNGLILLPDDWDTSYYALSLYNANTIGASYSSNMISLSEWSKLEQHGAVFLSAAGLRMAVPTNLSDQIDDFIYDVGSYGNYWSASVYDDEEAWVLKFGDAIYTPVGSYSRGYGCSVRLVCDVH